MSLPCSRVFRGTARSWRSLNTRTGPLTWLPACSLLNDPNTGSPANVEASNLYKDNRKEYTKRVRETVEKSWED